MLSTILPFIILLIVAIVFFSIPMEPVLQRIGGIVIGVVALVMLLQFTKIL